VGAEKSSPQDLMKDVEMSVSCEGRDFVQKRPEGFGVFSFGDIAIDCALFIRRRHEGKTLTSVLVQLIVHSIINMLEMT
jgi:hypothetical protein